MLENCFVSKGFENRSVLQGLQNELQELKYKKSRPSRPASKFKF